MTQLTTTTLADRAAESLAWLAPLGFKYFSSYTHFRRKTPTGFAYITVNCVTHNRIHYHLAFYLGVQVREVELTIKALRQSDQPLTHYDRSLWCYSVNIGPKSPHWDFPISGTWSLLNLSDFNQVEGEVRQFVETLALPYVTGHDNPETIRNTLLQQPGHAQNIYPYEQILAIDLMNGDLRRLDADIATLDQRYERYAADPRKRYDEFIKLVRAHSIREETPNNALERTGEHRGSG